MKILGSISALIIICWHWSSCNNSPKTETTSKDSSTKIDTSIPIKSDTLSATDLPKNTTSTAAESYTFPKPIWETHALPPIETEDNKLEHPSISDRNSSDAPLLEDSTHAYTVVDQMPVFKKFNEFFEENFTVPNNEINVKGVIRIGYIVDRYGYVGDVKVLRSSGSIEIDEAVVKTIKKTSGLWTPGKIKGENVNTKMALPITIDFDE